MSYRVRVSAVGLRCRCAVHLGVRDGQRCDVRHQPGGRCLYDLLCCPSFENCLAREADFSLCINSGDHHGNLIANAHSILHFIDADAVELGDVHHAINVRQDFDESAKVSGAHDPAGINTADDR